MRSEDLGWDEAYSLLSTSAISDPEDICAAITRLGKPFNEERIAQAAPIIEPYLRHDNFLVRSQAAWFLGCWGKLPRYLSLIIRAAQNDIELDNRAFAARCAGQILKSSPDKDAIRALLQIAISEDENDDIRAAAYSALLYAFHGVKGRAQAREFEPAGCKSVRDFDVPWLESLKSWVEQLG